MFECSHKYLPDVQYPAVVLHTLRIFYQIRSELDARAFTGYLVEYPAGYQVSSFAYPMDR